MLELKVYDDGREVVLRFEHSLRSVSKWESKHKVAFLTNREKSNKQLLEYFQDMLLSTKIDPNLVYLLKPDQLDRILEYISDAHTASTVPNDNSPKSRETITAELIYAWMVLLEIPFDADQWHLNNLMMMIQIINIKKAPAKKVSGVDQMADYRAINAANKKRFNTNG